MSAALSVEPPARPHVRTVPDGRPPARGWSSSPPSGPEHPTLLFAPVATREPGPPTPIGHRTVTIEPAGIRATSPALPDIRSWSASLALALAETLQGRRPVGQLSRWVDDTVLATLSVAVRSVRSPASRPTTASRSATASRLTASRSTAAAQRPAVLRSIHLQFPRTDVVEASAHIQLDQRSTALALRLEGWFDRWLCTALELGPHDQRL